MTNYYVDEIEELLIFQYLKNTSSDTLGDVTKEPFDNLGMKQKAWTSEKGRRVKREYVNENDEVVVRDCFHYVNNPVDPRKITTFSRSIEWLKLDGSTIGLEKSVNKEVTTGKVIELNIAIRENQINYLRDLGEGLRAAAKSVEEPIKTQYMQVADAVDNLWLHYEKVIKQHESIGGDVFVNAINNETDPSILFVLNIDANDKGETVKDVILNQIT